MSSSPSLFLIGPGFIGQALLSLLLTDPAKYAITTMVRRKEHGAQLEKQGFKVIYGDLHDHDAIAQQTASSDIVFHTATADDMPSVLAVLDGIKKRAKDGKSTMYIHTSGTSLLADGAKGMFRSDKVYSDATREEIDSLPDSAPHRSIDLAIVKAQQELGDKAKVAIVAPPLIYGYNKGNGRLSIQLPALVKFAVKHGYGGYVGRGESVWSTVHVNDLARGYVAILHKMESKPPSYTLENPYFFCENGEEFAWKEAAEEIARGLHRAEKINEVTVKTIPEDLYDDVCGEPTSSVVACNSRSRAVRLRELGWKPQEKSVFESLQQDELPAILQHG